MHKPNYLELTCPDMAAAKAFYGTAFGWEFTDYGPTYASIPDGDVEVGLTLGEPGKPPISGFQTDDIEAAEAKVRAAGGAITQAIYEFPGGRRFHFTDPANVEFIVYIYEE